MIGKGRTESTWLYVPSSFASLYMTYLANSIAAKNNLQLISDSSAAWTGATYFKYDGKIDSYCGEDFTNQLAVLVIRDFVPENITDISPEVMLRFRRQRKDERQRFVNSIKKAAKQISACKDPKIIADLVEDLKKDIKIAARDYRKSADLLKVSGWLGMKSITFPVATPVISTIVTLGPTTLTVFAALGLGLGLVSGLTELKQKQKKLSKEADYSYLVHLSRDFKGYHFRDDYNCFLNNQMNEFIHD